MLFFKKKPEVASEEDFRVTAKVAFDTLWDEVQKIRDALGKENVSDQEIDLMLEDVQSGISFYEHRGVRS